MNDRDKELDSLLEPLQKKSVSELHIHRWKLAINRELKKNRRANLQLNWGWPISQIAASILLGIIIGKFVFDSPDKGSYLLAKKMEPVATYEYIYAKSPIED